MIAHRLLSCLVPLALAAAAIFPAPARAAPDILLLPALGRPSGLTIVGRVLRKAPHGSSAFSRNLRRLTERNWEGAPVEVHFAGLTARTTSGDDGDFEVTFSAPADHPFPAGQQPVEAIVPGVVTVQAQVEILADDAPFFVISDVDDTVAVSNITTKRGVIVSGLLEDGDTHPAVPGMAAFYQCLRAVKSPPPGFAYVTGTPIPYLHRMEAFLSRNGFPFAGLYLRDLSLKTLSGYKQPHIRKLLKRLSQKVILIGDSGEKDPEVYAQMRREFPGRVAAIFIRNVGKAERPSRFEGMFLFDQVDQAVREAVAKGFANGSCLPGAPSEPRPAP